VLGKDHEIVLFVS